MVETNNPKHLSNSKGDKLINWERRQVMADTIHRMLYAQDTPYNLLPVHQIRQLLLERAGALEEEVLLSISKKVEPRGAKIDDIRPWHCSLLLIYQKLSRSNNAPSLHSPLSSSRILRP